MAAIGGGPLTAVASLSITGIDSYLWTGDTCTTGSGRYAASVFGPAEITNDPVRQESGLLAIVDLVDGDVEVSTERVALSQAALGCGAGDEGAGQSRVGDEGAGQRERNTSA